MKPNFGRPAVLIAMIALACMFIGNSAFAAITAVTRTGATQTSCAPVLGGPLVEGAQAYCDRLDPEYTYINLPIEFDEFTIDYVVVAVEDRELVDYGLQLTVDYPGYIMLFIEQDLDIQTYMPWVIADGYVGSPWLLTLDKQGAYPQLDMLIALREVPAGEIQVGPVATGPQAEPGTGSMYGVAYITKEVDVELAVEDVPDPVLAGSGAANLVHTLTVTNNASLFPATGVTVAVTEPSVTGVTVDSAVASGIGTYSAGTWTLVDDLAPGASATLTLTMTVANDVVVGTDVIATSGVASVAEFDTDDTNNTASAATSVETAADLPSGFNTTIDFLGDNEGMVTVVLTCNAGLPLSQTFDISEASGVSFAMTNLPFTTPGTECEITVEGLPAGYESTASANGAAVADSCVFVAGTAETGEALFDVSGANTCAFVASAGLASYTVSVDWMLDDPNVEEADYSVEITATCDANILTVNGSVVAPSMQYVGPLDDGESVVLGVDVTAGAAECSAEQAVTQSGVESEASAACTEAELPAGGSAECVFTNTVFFEGIPTLSQYGMALMALLMLGVGFVGFRRFV